MVLIATWGGISNGEAIRRGESYHSPPPGNIGAGSPHTSNGNTAEAAISDLFEDLKSVFEGRDRGGRGGPRGEVVDGHGALFCQQMQEDLTGMVLG